MKRRKLLSLLVTASGGALAASAGIRDAEASGNFWYRRKMPGVSATGPAGPVPVWVTAGDLGSLAEGSSVAIDLVADRAVAYEVTAGNLPPDISLSPTGQLSGVLSAVSADETFAFTVRASNPDGNVDRVFSLTVLDVPSGSQRFTASGSFTVPAGVTSLQAKVWGAGGGRGGRGGTSSSHQTGGYGGGGGFAGGTIDVTPGEVLTVVVGLAGTFALNALRSGGGGGGASAVISGGTTLIAAGGGGGGGGGSFANWGGSGGGGMGENAPVTSGPVDGQDAAIVPGQSGGVGGAGAPRGGNGGDGTILNGSTYTSNGGGGGGYPGGLSSSVSSRPGIGGDGGYGLLPLGGTSATGTTSRAGNEADPDWSSNRGRPSQPGLVVLRWGAAS